MSIKPSSPGSGLGKKVVAVITIGVLLFGAWLIIDHLQGPDCGDFLGFDQQRKLQETATVLRRSGMANENANEWVIDMESYCRSNRSDHLKDLEAEHGWGWGW